MTENKDGKPDIRLHEAAQNGDLKAIDALIAEGVPVNGRTDLGETPLMFAARGNQMEAFTKLQAHGGDPALADNFNRTPWWIAKNYEDHKIKDLCPPDPPELVRKRQEGRRGDRSL